MTRRAGRARGRGGDVPVSTSPHRLVLNFIAPSTRHPSGGVAVVYEFACAMARRGHAVHLFHGGFFEGNVDGLEDIDWFEFDAPVIHHFAPEGAERRDGARCGRAVRLRAGAGGADPDRGAGGADPGMGHARQRARGRGVPRPLPEDLRGDVAGGHGAPDRRRPSGSWCTCPSACARRSTGSAARSRTARRASRTATAPTPRRVRTWRSRSSTQSHAAVPEAEVTMFGAVAPVHPIPDWIDYRQNPSQRELVDDIYNGSQRRSCARARWRGSG